MSEMTQWSGLFALAERLADKSEPRLWRGIGQGALEAIFGAVPYVCLYLLLADLMSGTITMTRSICLFSIMLASLILQMWIGVRSMINIMTAAYSLFGAARLRVAEHIRKLPLGWFERARSGVLAEVMTGQMQLLSEIWSHFISYFAGGVAIPLVVGLFLLSVDVRLGFVLLATLPVAYLALTVAQRLQRRLIAHVLPVIASSNHEIVDYVRGIPVLRIYGRYGDGLARLSDSLERVRRAIVRAEVVPAPLIGAFGATIDAGQAVLLYVAAYLWLGGELDAQTLLLFVVVSMKFFQPLFDLGASILLLRFANQALAATEKVLNTPTLPEANAPQYPSRYDVSLKGVSFRYDGDERYALRDVSAYLPARSLTAIVGASGSGKSTLVHLIGRLWDVTDGAIEIGGIDVRDMATRDLHSKIAMVFQDVVLFEGSIADNLRVGNPDASLDELKRATRAAQAHDFISALPQGYDTVVGEAGATLSGGEKQRISIARALLKEAPIVLLDEATASMDPAAEAQIQRAIDALVRERTVVVIAHRLRTIARADQIIVLEEGRISQSGHHDELLQNPGRYAAMWEDEERGLRRRRGEATGPTNVEGHPTCAPGDNPDSQGDNP